jgi:hypothetical protein
MRTATLGAMLSWPNFEPPGPVGFRHESMSPPGDVMLSRRERVVQEPSMLGRESMAPGKSRDGLRVPCFRGQTSSRLARLGSATKACRLPVMSGFRGGSGRVKSLDSRPRKHGTRRQPRWEITGRSRSRRRCYKRL